jgi:hypothetical protein
MRNKKENEKNFFENEKNFFEKKKKKKNFDSKNYLQVCFTLELCNSFIQLRI